MIESKGSIIETLNNIIERSISLIDITISTLLFEDFLLEKDNFHDVNRKLHDRN